MNFLKLIRYKNLIMVLLTMVLTKYALIDSFFKETFLSDIDFIILAISILLITSGGYIINDIYDIETDKKNKPDKVFIDKTISKKKAWKSYLTLTLLGFTSGIFLSLYKLNTNTLALYVLTVLALFLYSKLLKKQVLIGNLLVSFLIVLPIFMVVSLSIPFPKELTNSNFNNTIYLYLFFAFLSTLIREIIKDIEDIDGDLKIEAKTLPILVGRKRASKVAFFLTGILFVFLLVILQYLKNDTLFLSYGIIFLLLPLLYFIYKLWFSENKKDFSILSNLMKIIMLFGILSMLLFKI